MIKTRIAHSAIPAAIFLAMLLPFTAPSATRAGDAGIAGITDWEIVGGAWRIVSNAVECTQETPGWGKTLLLSGPLWQDGEVNARILRVPREGGLIVRWRDPEHWIGILFYAGELGIYEMSPEGIHHLPRVAKAYPEKTPFTVGIRLAGKQLQVSINGEDALSTELPWAQKGRMGFFSYSGGLKVSDLNMKPMEPEAAPAKTMPFPAWETTALERTLRAEARAQDGGVLVTGRATLTAQAVAAEPPTLVRWSLRAWTNGAVVAEAATPIGLLHPLAPVEVTCSIRTNALPAGLYILCAELEAGAQRSLPWGALVAWQMPEPDPAALKWSAKTSDWRFTFTGTRASLAELARRYADYYEPLMPQLITAKSRELDTALGAYAVLFAQSKDKAWADKYRRLAVNLALARTVLTDLWSDPTVQNDLITSYRFMREQGVFSATEREWMEGWIAWLLPQMGFPMQHANHGRWAMAARALKGTRHEGRAEALLQGAGEPFRAAILGGNDAFAYDRIDWKHQTYWAETVDPQALTNESFRDVSRAYFTLWTPTGIQPGYGDDTGSSFWDPILPEWMAAHYLRNGEYKAIAIRALQFALDHDQLRELGSQPAFFTLWSHADDTLQPTNPALAGGLVPFLQPPDKLVIRGGWAPDDPYLLFDLWGGTGHNHADQGGLGWFIWMGQVWMADSNYDVRETTRHNTLCVEGREAVKRVSELLPETTATNATGIVHRTGFVSDEYGTPGQRWTRQVEHTAPPRGGAAGHGFRITDSIEAELPSPPPARILWHIRGVPKLVTDREWHFTQGNAVLEVKVAGGTVALQPYEEPKQLQIGTGCPPDTYRLCWGEPYSVLTIIPDKGADEEVGARHVMTEFRISIGGR